jgi:hypothetical protein
MRDALNVDFSVTSLVHFATSGREWLVCKDSVSNCVGVQDDVEAATAQAIRMAQYYAARRDDVQVHIEVPGAAGHWRTIWHHPDFEPRFPTCAI